MTSFAVFAALLLGPFEDAAAIAISDPIAVSGPFHFRDTRTETRSGFFIGDRLAVGALSVTPNPDSGVGGELTTVVARQDGFEFELAFIGGVFGGQYVNSTAFDAGLTAPWQVVARNSGSPIPEISVTTPAVGAASLVPFVSDGTMSPAGSMPTISWRRPDAFSPDQVRIFILDLDRSSADGSALVIHRADLPGNATSFPVPALLESGDALAIGGRYEIAVQLQRFRGDGSLLSRSRTFFSFSPLASGGEVALPIVGPRGVFTFDHAVEAALPIVLETESALGVHYAIGVGDPLFESVRVLTSLGDGVYDLIFESAGSELAFSLLAGEAFSFAPFGGVDAFSILGMDGTFTSAFLTELTFASDGRFTGTVSPLAVPAPPSLLLVAAALAVPRQRRLRWRSRQHSWKRRRGNCAETKSSRVRGFPCVVVPQRGCMSNHLHRTAA